MQSKDIVVGKPYLVNNRVCVVIDKGKFERSYHEGATFTLDVGNGAYTETVTNYWYGPADKVTARIVVWGIGNGRVEVVQPRQIDCPASEERFIECISKNALRDDLNRIQQEEDKRSIDANRRVAEIVATVLGRDPNSVSLWEASDPWRMVIDDREFIKKTFMLYLKVLVSKGEQFDGWDVNELIDDLRENSRAAKEVGARRAARFEAATAAISSTLKSNSTIRVYQPVPELEQVNV